MEQCRASVRRALRSIKVKWEGRYNEKLEDGYDHKDSQEG